ncbi:MAG: molybdopterin oxidoreductase [Deltaproteobacteria bacterium]|nr:molybdopterin oxidoreductase [Deltaproteobacteria bacterium]
MTEHANRQRLHGYCGLCIARCGTVATVEDGRFIRLDPDPSHPTGHAICAKGRAAPELVYHPERLTHPLRRTRPKGDTDPGWERISWDTALDLTASAMRRIADQHGPEAVAFSIASPSTTTIADSAGFIRRLMNAFGTPNGVTSLDVCGWGRGFATRYAYGVASVATGSAGGAMADIGNSGCLIFWGYNPSFTRLPHATAAVEAQKRGMKFIVIDPRHAGLASKAGVWLRVRPGTDGALALGLANLMIQQGWYDAHFIRTWTNGPLLVRNDNGRLLTANSIRPDGHTRHYVAWDATNAGPVTYDPTTGGYDDNTTTLALDGEYRIETIQGEIVCRPVFALYAALCRKYSPDIVEQTCWIPRKQLEETAQLLWHSRPVSYYAWSGHEQQANATQTARAMSLLYALTGCFDAPGGNVLLPAIPSTAITGEDLPAAQTMAPALGVEKRPLGPARWNNIVAADLYRAILHGNPYPVLGLIGFGSNMLLSHVDGDSGRTALAALAFYAHADLFMTPTAALADVVLPVASAFEREALKIGFEISTEAQSLIQFRQPVVSPPGEARADTDIIFDLATRLGLAAHFWNGNIEAAYRHQLAPSGVTLEALRAQPKGIRVPLQVRHCKHAELDAHGNPRGFATPSRKIEIYSETFLEHGYAPLPDFTEPSISPASQPALTGRFPLVLTCAKPSLFCQSQYRSLPSLRKRAADPAVALHPEAAKVRGITQGDWVTIETPEGSVRARASLDTDLDPRVVVGEHGWWQGCTALGTPGYDPFTKEGANYNLLIGDDTRDPISGTASIRAYLCEVRLLAQETMR